MSENHIIRTNYPFYEIPDISVAEFVNNILQQLDGQTKCLIEANSGREFTINELIRKANSIAKALIERGIKKSDILLSFAANSIELAIVLFAAMFLGITLYPIHYIVNVYELQTLLKTLDSITIFTDRERVKTALKLYNNNDNEITAKNIVVLDGVYDNYLTFDQLLKEGENESLDKIPYFKVRPKDDIFVYLQSSGTSGVPKSVMISHKAYLGILLNMKKNFVKRNYSETQPIVGHVFSFGCMYGVNCLFGYICCGAVVVIHKEYNEELILQSIEKYKINALLIVPTLGNRLLNKNNYDLSSLKFVHTAGAPFPGHIARAIIDKYNIPFCEGYGMTEFGGISSSGLHTSDYIQGNLGQPTHNTEIKVIDLNNGKSLGPNMDGELCVRGPTMCSGFLNNTVATNETIDSEGWLHTGDIGHYDQLNRFFITDRLKEMIKSPTNVSPSEIEQFLLTHRAVAEVAVVGVTHETEYQWPRAYIKVRDNMSVTEEELKKFVSDSMSYSKTLRAGVVFVEHIPRTTFGKVNRRYFKQLIANEVIKS